MVAIRLGRRLLLATSGGDDLPSDEPKPARHSRQAGRTDEGRRMLREIEASPDARNVPENLATIYTALGDREAAFDLLNRAVSARVQNVVWLKVDPRFAPLHADPRFAALLRQIGLPQE